MVPSKCAEFMKFVGKKTKWFRVVETATTIF